MDGGVLFDRLLLWRDPVPRSGPESMAIDEWLLEHAREPLLRVYEWDGNWVSLGYFGKALDAERWMLDGETRLVRRATGGGMVDHRVDQTYTLVVPRGHEVASMRGAESYRVIHEALADAMREMGTEARLIEGDGPSDSAACFERPVAWDVVDAAGRKLAGAGQRRTRHGLLHQGSVVLAERIDGLFDELARLLGGEVEMVRREPAGERFGAAVAKFASRAWTERR